MNSITGFVIWEDWWVVQSWFGYMCVFALLGLGCDLLLSTPQLNNKNPVFGLHAILRFHKNLNSDGIFIGDGDGDDDDHQDDFIKT